MLLYSASREQLRRRVWEKGRAIVGADSSRWRRDAGGWVMQYADYDNHASPYCWVMHHRVPKHRGGSGAAFNLTPVNTGRLRASQDPSPWARRR